MNNYLLWINQLNWWYIVIACLTLGLAPFSPPHVLEKLLMLINGTLKRPLDWFDLFFHGIPWILLLLKISIFLLSHGSKSKKK